MPVFEQPAPAAPAPKAAFVPDPVPRRAGGPKPIDWHADLLSRIDAARQAPAAPAAPAQQPAPAQPAAPAHAAEAPAWKHILESAMMDHIPVSYKHLDVSQRQDIKRSPATVSF